MFMAEYKHSKIAVQKNPLYGGVSLLFSEQLIQPSYETPLSSLVNASIPQRHIDSKSGAW